MSNSCHGARSALAFWAAPGQEVQARSRLRGLGQLPLPIVATAGHVTSSPGVPCCHPCGARQVRSKVAHRLLTFPPRAAGHAQVLGTYTLFGAGRLVDLARWDRDPDQGSGEPPGALICGRGSGPCDVPNVSLTTHLACDSAAGAVLLCPLNAPIAALPTPLISVSVASAGRDSLPSPPRPSRSHRRA